MDTPPDSPPAGDNANACTSRARGRDFSGQPARTGPSKLAPFPGAKRSREIQSGMKNHAVTPAGQRLAMDVNEWRARALVQPHVSKSDAAFNPEALDRHARQFRRNCQIDEQGEAFAAAQGPVQMHDSALARCHTMAASLA